MLDSPRIRPGTTKVSEESAMTPHDRYGELFEAVAMAHIFEDSKTFADCIPKQSPEQVMSVYEQHRDRDDFDLQTFVSDHFDADTLPGSGYESRPEHDMSEHIDRLWPILTRNSRHHPQWSSLLSLSHDYVVPGGRFREYYYWDSYFTMLGLAASGEGRLLRAVTDNCADLIERYGHMPNGNRSYYLSRSQPPLFSMMVELVERQQMQDACAYLPQLEREYAFWMDGEDRLQPGESHRRCVRLDETHWLNRHWDDRSTPREESFREDLELSHQTSRPAARLFRDLRAGSETGWDFSGRWLDDVKDITTIRTTAFVTPDLNALLFHLEQTLARLNAMTGAAARADEFGDRARRRQAAMDRYLWSEDHGAYFDYDIERGSLSPHLTAASVVPLFVRAASRGQADRVAGIVARRLLAPGGIATTEISDSHQQWDHPNGWAPLQWMAIEGLGHYGFEDLAETIADRWLALVQDLYDREHKLVEKYVLYPGADFATGGEYPLQDGFGWTNGVTRALLARRAGKQ
ncbi:alpha,alpha-trehalase TreF [Salinicola rhizosphaerae]|uniref:Cytoplasmic trehalase n=1 Tax=Salinicola rhizosphaerae TaxID=1443141 RepID=A0ABQ3DTK4_9GAMM|nr:alpha,alpha-trehalase TreF [Salinicola rhizosphaerae]GHB15896.1 cytoplasmic trehalase [Salinicola rhizosphaerae]